MPQGCAKKLFKTPKPQSTDWGFGVFSGAALILWPKLQRLVKNPSTMRGYGLGRVQISTCRTLAIIVGRRPHNRVSSSLLCCGSLYPPRTQTKPRAFAMHKWVSVGYQLGIFLGYHWRLSIPSVRSIAGWQIAVKSAGRAWECLYWES